MSDSEPVAPRSRGDLLKLPASGLNLTLTRRQRWLATILPLALLLYPFLASRAVLSIAGYEQPPQLDAASRPTVEPNGAVLYAQHCARCHGERGQADGITSPSLDPPARKFGQEKFQLATTINGIPSDEDLTYIIRHGIPGTGMPDFAFLTDEECRALIGHVRILTQAGIYHRLYQRALKEEEVFVPELALAAAKEAKPGPPYPVPADLPAATPESIARGERIFLAICATCHGPRGAGDGPQVKGMKNDNGVPTRPRDLARGVFKGGGEPHRLYVRTALGMPGTPMPASAAALKPEQIGDLVNFVLSLSQGQQTQQHAH